MALDAIALTAGQNVYDDGYLRIEYDNYYVTCGGKIVTLPRKEFLIISRLALNAGRIVSSEMIWRHAWGDDKQFNPRSLRVHIHRLRSKLKPLGLDIETMARVGYRIRTG
jgi:DNA-binding response OmpR family regulator